MHPNTPEIVDKKSQNSLSVKNAVNSLIAKARKMKKLSGTLRQAPSQKYWEMETKLRPDVSCCPVKQVVGEEESAGLFVLGGKTPDRRDHCSENCKYVKVSR